MSQELIELIVLFLLLAFLIGIIVAVDFLLVTGIPDFARVLFLIWYVLTV